MSSSHLPLGCVKQGNWWPWLTRSLCRRFLDQNWIVKLFCTVHQGHIHFVILWSSLYYQPFEILASFDPSLFFLGHFWVLLDNCEVWNMWYTNRKWRFLIKIHNGKNLPTYGKNLQTVHFGTHQISIGSANFCLTPPRFSGHFYE